MADVFATLKARQQGEWFPSASYEDLLEAVGLTVEESERFGSYQGDAIALVSDGVRRGIVVWGYGSCSGCDALEAAQPYAYNLEEAEKADWKPVNELADSMLESVRWAEPGEDLSAVARGLLDKSTDWYIYDDEMKAWLERRAGQKGDG